MRGWLATCVVALGSGAAALAPASGAQDVHAFDWQVVVITAGVHGAKNVWVGESLVGSSTDNDQAFVVGVGEPKRHASYGFSADVPWDPQAPKVTTTRVLGGVAFTVVQQRAAHGVSSALSTSIPEMAAGETMAVIDAQAHAELPPADVSEKVEHGSLASVHVYRGTGTDYLPFADPTEDGTAVAVGPAAAGS